MHFEGQQISVVEQGHSLLTDIDLTIASGEYWCIVGPNGAGKSTLLRCLNGLQKIRSGHLSLQSKPLQHFSRKQLARHISYVPQHNGRHLPFTVQEFMAMSRYAHQRWLGHWQQTDIKAIDEALMITDCEAFRDRQLSELSGGECQRVMIAAALAQETPVLLLDEPTSFLDPQHQSRIQQLVQQLHHDLHKTIIEVSHDINHAGQHADNILALKAGQVFWQGAARQFINAERLFDLYCQRFVITPHPQTHLPIALPEIVQ
ncbi:Ferrichrome transport ATP-binding protein FhuC [Methylophaga frappieri]|uniref:Ferrichrome transport ATP-binding protein FhuC n=1 Tax=Methylophaga frappieri (strain ATCC BAA-2434 / DSM 25690 / JAM7) TaxID=754477 RepID=I1YFW7_METFJ|nr:ABC transporter ATP-binding protein [Methylophaga frappieri]AFJ01810.1 Ferrichrome transport ATP-binding protein FhuC [Methylophaga frappieri]